VEEPARQYLPALQGPVPSGPEEPDAQYRPAGHREQLPDANVVHPTGQETPEGTSQDPMRVVEPAGQYLSPSHCPPLGKPVALVEPEGQ
jgi:hypothetical protein